LALNQADLIVLNQKRLANLFVVKIDQYRTKRNSPMEPVTSQLSVYLKNGLITISMLFFNEEIILLTLGAVQKLIS
jgi:deoxyribodipyrimidine photolyase